MVKRLLYSSLAVLAVASTAWVSAQQVERDEGGIEIRGPRGNKVVDIELPNRRPAVDRGLAFRSSQLVGMPVQNAAGEDLGKIEDLVLDLNTGRVRYAALSFGGFLGVGDKLFAVPWGALRMKTVGEDTTFVLDVSKERLEKAPGFSKDQWPNMAEPNWAREIDTYYGDAAVRVGRL
jgi:sporulation protein YlmC with PRC-barrel domain